MISPFRTSLGGCATGAASKVVRSSSNTSARLYEAIEVGAIDIADESLKIRVQKLEPSRESTLLELARARAKQYAPTPRVLPSQLDAFSQAIRKRLLDRRAHFAKRYLRLLVDEIVINGDEAAIHGSYDRLSAAIRQTKKGTLDQVPSFMGEWRARED
jgi:site-specific DNA recombinase